MFLVKHRLFFLQNFYNQNLQLHCKHIFFAAIMKRIIAILLILITALYVLPVSDGIMADTETTCKFADKNTDDNKDTKKDSGKEFIPFVAFPNPPKNNTEAVIILPLLSALPVHFTIETPPPDQA